MAVATWPASLPPKLDREEFEETFPETTLRTQMDIGPAKARRRFTAQVSPIRGSIVLTQDQAAALRAFYVDTVAGGASRFNWTHPRTGAPCEMRFTAAPKLVNLGGAVWKASLQLEVMP